MGVCLIDVRNTRSDEMNRPDMTWPIVVAEQRTVFNVHYFRGQKSEGLLNIV